MFAYLSHLYCRIHVICDDPQKASIFLLSIYPFQLYHWSQCILIGLKSLSRPAPFIFRQADFNENINFREARSKAAISSEYLSRARRTTLHIPNSHCRVPRMSIGGFRQDQVYKRCFPKLKLECNSSKLSNSSHQSILTS